MANTNFLPAISNNQGNVNTLVPLNQMMTGMKTGESFARTRNHFQARTGRVSPVRSASITALLSPKEMVKEFTRRGS